MIQIAAIIIIITTIWGLSVGITITVKALVTHIKNKEKEGSVEGEVADLTIMTKLHHVFYVLVPIVCIVYALPIVSLLCQCLC